MFQCFQGFLRKSCRTELERPKEFEIRFPAKSSFDLKPTRARDLPTAIARPDHKTEISTSHRCTRDRSRKIYNRVHRGGITICQTTDGNFVGATRKTRCSSPAFFSPRYRLTYGRVCSQQADGWPFRNDVPINRLSTRRQGASIFRKTAKNDSLNRK